MKNLAITLAGVACFTAAPALAAETISVPFTMPDGGVTTGTYSGIVRVRVSGTGFSLGTRINDAFYDVANMSRDPNFYQLTFGTTTLTPFNPAQNAFNFLVGPLPAYNASHVYTFFLNTGALTPTTLHFGVGDGAFGDNGGAYRVTVSSVPEPATWGMMLAGFGLAGAALRRRNAVKVSFA